jgi:hypothetical protein
MTKKPHHHVSTETEMERKSAEFDAIPAGLADPHKGEYDVKFKNGVMVPDVAPRDPKGEKALAHLEKSSLGPSLVNAPGYDDTDVSVPKTPRHHGHKGHGGHGKH